MLRLVSAACVLVAVVLSACTRATPRTAPGEPPSSTARTDSVGSADAPPPSPPLPVARAALVTSAETGEGAGEAGPGVEPVPKLEVDATAPVGELPHRIWWRSDGGTKPPLYLAATPGGERLGGEWSGGSSCSLDSRPTFLWRGPPDAPDRRLYHGHWVWTDRDDVRWWLFSRDRREDGTDPAFTDEQRTLLGRWLHTEEDFRTEIELLEGGRARSREGGDWEWIADGDCLELRRPYRGVMLVLNCLLSADRNTYGRNDVVAGARIVGPK